MGSKGSNTTTTSSSPPAWVNQAYQDIYGRANTTAQTPYSAYTGNQVAGFSPDQQTAFQNVNNAQGMAQSYIDAGMDYTAQGAVPVAQMTGADIQQYQNPFTSMVTDATMANINETNAQQMQKLQGNAALQGAMGGDRMGVAKAELARQQNLSNNQTLANLSSSAFDKAAGLAGNQQLIQQQNAARAGQAAYSAGSLGSQAQNSALQGAQAQLQTGAQQQGLSQAQLNAAYQQWMEQQAFPYQQTQWLAGIGSGVGSGAGGTSSTTAPAPSLAGQIIGAAGTAAGAYLSDERAKDDIEHVGALFDGQPVYRYRYKGDPRTQIGLLAQDVEQAEPEAVGQAGGFKTVDYNAATDAAAVRGSFAQGGMAGTPWSGAGGYIPQGGQITHGSGPPKPPSAAGSGNAENMMSRASGMAGRLRNSMSDPTDLSAPGVDSYSPAQVGETMPFSPATGFDPIYARGGLVPGYADGGSPIDYINQGFDDAYGNVPPEDTGPFVGPMPPEPDPTPQPTAPKYEGGAFGGMGFKPLGWDDQPTPAAAVPGKALGYADEGEETPVDPTTVPVPVAKTTPGLEPRAPRPPPVDADITADDPSALNPQGGVAAPKKSSGINWRGPFSDDWKPNLPLMTAGLAMMASRSPNLGNVIGEGGLAGVSQYTTEKKAEALAQNQSENRTIKKSEVAARLEQLKATAKYHAEQLRLAGERDTNTNKYRQDSLKQRGDAATAKLEAENWVQYPGEQKDADGNSVPGIISYNRKTNEQRFSADSTMTPKGGAKGAPSTAVEREANAIMKAEPDVTREVALKRAATAMAKPSAPGSSPLERVATEIQAANPGMSREDAITRAQSKIKPNQNKPMPEGVRKVLDSAVTGYEKVNNYIQTYNPKFSGMKYKPVGEAANLAGQYLGVGGQNNVDAGDWWANYASHRNEVRKSLFGSALTQTEKVEFDKADINRAMTTEAIERNLKRQQYWAHRALQKTAGPRYAEGIYSKEAIDQVLGGMSLEDMPHPDAVNVVKPPAKGDKAAPAAAAPAAAPAAPAFMPPEGSKANYARKQYQLPDGSIVDFNGKPVSP